MSDIENYDFEKIIEALPDPEDYKEAEKRYNKYKSKDPFPEILPALLNTADIIDYVIATGMIHPFYPENANLKPASYEISILGKYVYFDENNDKKVEKITKGKKFILKKNSIGFVTLEPYFRIPDYIALRFNLKIMNVYRGILLGTGPLVDPGFEGLLSIPLHNLTTNDYEFTGGEELAYFEFTKLSRYEKWIDNELKIDKKLGFYVSFPKRKIKRKDVEDYLAHAVSHRPIRSSIPEASIKAQKALDETEKIKRITYLSIIGIFVTLLAGVGAIFMDVNSLIRNTNDTIFGVRSSQYNFQQKINGKIDELKLENELLKSHNDSLQTIINSNSE